MDAKKLISEFLATKNVMQLATSVDGQPWVCTVHFYADEDFSLYWVSTEARRHSQDIVQNPKVAAAILVHENTEEEKYIIGISIEGTAELLGSTFDERIEQAYADKLHKPAQLMADIKSGQNPHKFYRLRPTKLVLFDTKNLSDQPRQEMIL